MKKKLIITSVLLILLGSMAIPGGVMANNYINDLVEHETDTGLKRIREEANPIVGDMVNATFASSLICTVTSDGESYYETFFNDNSTQGNYSVTTGGYLEFVSLNLHYEGNIKNFTKESQELILFGNYSEYSNYSEYANSSNYLPGIIVEWYKELVEGKKAEPAAWGMIDFLEKIENAQNNYQKRTWLEFNYNATWSQLNKLYDYIKEYLYYDIIPWSISEERHLQFRPELSVVKNSIDAIIGFYFHRQWANGSIISDPGFPLEPIAHLTDYPYGFEVGIPVATNMSLNSSRKLWDTDSKYSLVSKEGLKRWNYAVDQPNSDTADYLKVANDIDEGAFECIITWLPEFQSELMPVLAQYEYDLPMNAASLSNLIELMGYILGITFLGITAILLIRNALHNVKGAKKEREAARLHEIANKVNDKK